MRALIMLVLVSLVSARPPERVYVYTGAVRYSLDSLSTVSLMRHREEGACVTRWTETRAPESRTIYLLAIGPAVVQGADSVSIAFMACPDSAPTIHTHLTTLAPGVYDPYRPSVSDSAYVANHHAPFGLIVLAGQQGQVIPYGLKP